MSATTAQRTTSEAPVSSYRAAKLAAEFTVNAATEDLIEAIQGSRRRRSSDRAGYGCRRDAPRNPWTVTRARTTDRTRVRYSGLWRSLVGFWGL